MASDITRKTFTPRKHYSGVLMQQGRVQLDADWNEQVDIEQYRTHTESTDVIGQSGAPRAVNNGNSFKITVPPNGTDIHIDWGRIYVEGLLCELEQASSYLKQAQYPLPDTSIFNPLPGSPASPPASPLSPASPTSPPNAGRLSNGTYIVYLDAWQREVNYLDDPQIQEVALGGADTATRLQTAWQVKLLRVSPGSNNDDNCDTEYEAWKTLTQAPNGKLNVQTKQTSATQDPCLLPPSAGFRRVENQLYRIEVHRGGTLAQTMFKWSRDNATVETIIEKVQGGVLTVASTGKDEVLNFTVGNWVEVVDDLSDLNQSPQRLYQITDVEHETRKITLDVTNLARAGVGKMKLRRWDQRDAATLNGVTASNAWLDLEDGIQVQFSAGTYQTGDYWLVPARTVRANIEWPGGMQVPKGVTHHYTRLALLKVSDNSIAVTDCRRVFSALTDLEECDLRKHHKYLHGSGVVCGLKVSCRPDRERVLIGTGVALDCEGYMIEVERAFSYPIVQEALRLGYLNGEKKDTGMVCVSITRGLNKSVIIGIEPFVPKSFWSRVLEGTLIKDFWDHCIQNLIVFFKEQFPIPLSDVAPVPDQQRRLTAFINLFAQLINAKSGPYGFISGNTASERLDEDQFLRNFHRDLKELLASKTFCAMYDGDTPFPAYTIDTGLDTIFGPALKLHTRIRLHPSGNYAYTCGRNDRVYVYDLRRGELIQTIPFPSVAGIEIQDIAILDRTLFAVGILSGNSTFARAEILGDGSLRWNQITNTITNVKYVTLGLAGERLFAVAKTRGLYRISGIGRATISQDPITLPTGMMYNATGLLHIALHGRLWVAVVAFSTNPGIETDDFEAQYIFNLDTSSLQGIINIQGSDQANDITSFEEKVYATSKNAAGQRILGEYDLQNGTLLKRPADIPDDSFIRLAVYAPLKETNVRNYVLLTLSDQMKVARVPLNNANLLEIDPRFRIPVQTFPADIVISPTRRRAYVLNMLVNTLTDINMTRTFQVSSRPDYTLEPPPSELPDYRDQAVEAYKDVLDHLLQYLKDCFCDKFLIECPECDEDDKVYLGCVEIIDGRVHHICNFSKRKYVKSVRMVEYWLSTVPVLPIIREAFAKFCCMELGIELFTGKKQTD